MNKTELIDKIAAGAGISKADSKKALDATVNALKEALIAGDKIQLVGFGTFSVNERPAREGITRRFLLQCRNGTCKGSQKQSESNRTDDSRCRSA